MTLKFVRLQLESSDEVIYRTVDSYSQGFQTLSQINDHRVLAATAGKEHIALEDSIVVLADTRLKGSGVDTGCCRNDAVAVFRVIDPALDHLRDRKLVVNLERLGSIFGGLGKIELGNLLEVGDAVLFLIVLQALLNSAEFLLDNTETLIDKGGGVTGIAVLVVNPLFIIDVNGR